MRKIYVLTLVFFINSFCFARYNQAIGVQGGITGYGLGYKYFLEPTKYLEFHAQGKMEDFEKGAFLAGYYGWHNSINNPKLFIPNLSWFLGIGAQGGYYTEWEFLETNTVAGLSTQLGLETVVGEKVIFGLFARPYFNLLHTASIRKSHDFIDASIYVRFILN